MPSKTTGSGTSQKPQITKIPSGPSRPVRDSGSQSVKIGPPPKKS